MVLTVDEVKRHLRIDNDDEDALIEGLIRLAQAAAEDYCRVSFDRETTEPTMETASEAESRTESEPAEQSGSEPSYEPETEPAPENGQETSEPETVPEPVRLACLLFVSYHYENRDIPDMVTWKSMRMAFEHLLYPHRDPAQMF